jgi:hypothetical protein
MPFGFGSRKGDAPPSPFGGNTSSGHLRGGGPTQRPGQAEGARERSAVTGAVDHPLDAPGAPPPPTSGARPDPRPRPGPDAHTVARPRVVAVIGWTLLVALGVGMVLEGSPGMVIFGGIWTVGLGACFVLLLRSRVVVDGDLLYVRGVRGWRRPVDLRQLDRATSTWGSNYERWTELRDRHGAQVRIDGVNLQTAGLYTELARHIGPWDQVADAALQRRLNRYR